MYLVLETHGGLEYASIVADENGENIVFESLEEAQEAADDCQDGIVLNFVSNEIM